MSLGDSATPLGKVRGIGSAHAGGHHWLSERVTSIALLVLGTWLLASLLFLPSLDRRTLIEWLRAPSGAVPMVLFVIIAFRHALEGMKVVVDDYVHVGNPANGSVGGFSGFQLTVDNGARELRIAEERIKPF